MDDGETTFGETPATVKTVRALPKPVAEMTPEEKAHADAIDLRCLSLCIGMLERVNGVSICIFLPVSIADSIVDF